MLGPFSAYLLHSFLNQLQNVKSWFFPQAGLKFKPLSNISFSNKNYSTFPQPLQFFSSNLYKILPTISMSQHGTQLLPIRMAIKVSFFSFDSLLCFWISFLILYRIIEYPKLGSIRITECNSLLLAGQPKIHMTKSIAHTQPELWQA